MHHALPAGELDLGRINYRGQSNVDFGFDASKVTSKDELVRMKQKREIQHVPVLENMESAVRVIEMSGHELPADAFISPKRSTLRPRTLTTSIAGESALAHSRAR